jgi:hypothetical protein
VNGEAGGGGADEERGYRSVGVGSGDVRIEGVEDGILSTYDIPSTTPPSSPFPSPYTYRSITSFPSLSLDAAIVELSVSLISQINRYSTLTSHPSPSSSLFILHFTRHRNEAQLSSVLSVHFHSYLHALLSWQLGLHVQPCRVLHSRWSALWSIPATHHLPISMGWRVMQTGAVAGEEGLGQGCYWVVSGRSVSLGGSDRYVDGKAGQWRGSSWMS